MLEITNKQRRVLRKLAAHLASLPDNYDEFNMRAYAISGLTYFLPEETYKHRCGTVACAVGHLPKLGYKPLSDEDWGMFSARITGVREDSTEFDWCFASEWEFTDNTPLGAAQRITYMLDHPERTITVWADQAFNMLPKRTLTRRYKHITREHIIAAKEAA